MYDLMVCLGMLLKFEPESRYTAEEALQAGRGLVLWVLPFLNATTSRIIQSHQRPFIPL